MRNHVRISSEPESVVLFGEPDALHQDHAGLQGQVQEARIFHLTYVDRGVPRGKQRGGSDRLRNLRRQGVHVITEERAFIGVGVESQFMCGTTESLLTAFNMSCRLCWNGF